MLSSLGMNSSVVRALLACGPLFASCPPLLCVTGAAFPWLSSLWLLVGLTPRKYRQKIEALKGRRQTDSPSSPPGVPPLPPCRTRVPYAPDRYHHLPWSSSPRGYSNFLFLLISGLPLSSQLLPTSPITRVASSL